MKKKTKLLIVDDEDIVRESLCDWLSSIGYKVLTANCGEDALRIIKQKKVDSLCSFGKHACESAILGFEEQRVFLCGMARFRACSQSNPNVWITLLMLRIS